MCLFNSHLFFLGRSHNESFHLFQLGKLASEGIRIFSETGASDVLDELSQGEGGVYDEFIAPAIPKGVGRAEAEFFVDGNHSRVRFTFAKKHHKIQNIHQTKHTNQVFCKHRDINSAFI